MTIEDIERARQREIKIRRLRREIKELNNNMLPSKVKAIEINGQIQYTTGGHSSLPTSPVENHFRSLEQLEERLEKAERMQTEFWKQADTIEDDEIRAIIFWRVCKLFTWSQISAKIYGYGAATSTPYMRLWRWAERKEE